MLTPQLVLTGTNHKSAPIWLRERFHCGLDQTKYRLKAMAREGCAIREAVILSTCNRFEVYALTNGNEDSCKYLLEMLSDWSRTRSDKLVRHVYTLFNQAAATHLFAVTSGLDSLILGEQQIQIQVRNAARVAKEAGTAGRVLSGLFQSAYTTATRIRKAIGLGLDGTSVSSAAISLLTSRVPNASSVLIIGAGQMMTLAVNELCSAERREILVANRTSQRAEALARRVAGIPLPYEKIPSALEKVDAVLTFTSSKDYVINARDIELAMPKRHNRELTLIDGSVPRNIDPQAASISDVHLYNIDDLAPFVRVFHYREEEASVIINSEVAKFFARLRSYQANDTLRELRQLAEDIREMELSRAFNRMDQVSDRQKEIIDILTRRIINKLLYEPTARLKEHAGNGDGDSFDLLVRELFAINKENVL